MKKKILAMALVLSMLLCCMISVSAADGVYEGTVDIKTTTEEWTAHAQWTEGSGTFSDDGNGGVQYTYNQNKQAQAYFVMKKPYRFYSGCSYEISNYYITSGINGSCQLHIQTELSESQRICPYDNSWPENSSVSIPTTSYMADGVTKKGLYTTYAWGEYFNNGTTLRTARLDNAQFYSDAECTQPAEYADALVWMYMLGGQAANGSLGIKNVKITEFSPITANISGNGTIKVNGTALANGEKINLQTGGSFNVTFLPGEGEKIDSITYGGKTYKVYGNGVVIDGAQRNSTLDVVFTPKTGVAPLYESSFIGDDGISANWEFTSVNYWNTNNKKIRNIEKDGAVCSALSFYNINPGKAATQNSKFSAADTNGITVHAGAKYYISYDFYTENMVTQNGFFMSTPGSGFNAEIFKDGASKGVKTAQNIAASDFEYYSASGNDKKSASYAIKFNKINDSEDATATMNFGVYGEGKSRGDDINYDGIAFGFWNLKIRETSPLAAKITGEGSVTVNGTALSNGEAVDEVETGTPLDFTFSPAEGYEVESVKYGGNTYDAKDNKLSISKSTVCSDIEVSYKKAAASSPAIDSGSETKANAAVQTFTYTALDGSSKEYTGPVAVAYAKINSYTDGNAYKYAFDVTDPASGNTLRLECGDAAPGLAIAVRLIGGAIVEGTEYTIRPVIYE